MLRALTVLWHGMALVAILALGFSAPPETALMLPADLAPTPGEQAAMTPLMLMLAALLVGIVWLPGWLILLALRAALRRRPRRE